MNNLQGGFIWGLGFTTALVIVIVIAQRVFHIAI